MNSPRLNSRSGNIGCFLGGLGTGQLLALAHALMLEMMPGASPLGHSWKQTQVSNALPITGFGGTSKRPQPVVACT